MNSDDRVDKVLARAEELARSGLSGINEAAMELAELCGGDRRVIEQARRQILHQTGAHADAITKQIAWLIRRALELGQWNWDD